MPHILRVFRNLALGRRLWLQVIFSAALLLCSGSIGHSQEDATFSTEVKVVNLLAAVRTRTGTIVRDLTKEDFSLTENGLSQTIRYFSRESDLPLTIGLLVDTSMSQRRVLDAERGASLRFLDQVLRESKDQAFIMQFDMTVHTSQELTPSRKKLYDALSYVDTPTFRALRSQEGGGTRLYDAVLTASQDVMKNQKGRKALIVLSDGVDTGSDATLTDATGAAQRADTLVYSILFSDTGAYGIPFGPLMGHGGKNALMQISKETGAGFFEVSKKRSIEQIFEVIEEELRSQYNLGYVSDQPVRISEFRAIHVTTKQKGLVVQSRDKYWAQR